MKVKFKFRNGDKVRDKVTGLVGIIDMQSMLYSGNIQYSLQPRVQDENDTKKPEGWWMDEQQLELVEKTKIGNGKLTIDFKFDLGIKVQDQISGLKGIVTRATHYLNECIYYSVQPTANKDGKVPVALNLNELIVKKVGEGISEKVKEEVKPEKKKSPGGPGDRSHNMEKSH